MPPLLSGTTTDANEEDKWEAILLKEAKCPKPMRERFTARNVTRVTPDSDPQPPPFCVTQKWAATKQKYLAQGKTVLLKGCSDKQNSGPKLLNIRF